MLNSHDLQVVEGDYRFMALADKLMAKAILIRAITSTSYLPDAGGKLVATKKKS